jgi:CDP-diacylglycerol--glycerol-3-phosphate 3-phosphatidyltransferase
MGARLSAVICGKRKVVVIKNVPNLLTGLRIAVIPIFVLLMDDPSPFMRWVAIFIFLFAAITDLADGSIARRFHAVSDMGKLLDPIADKILVMSALVMLVAQRQEFDGSPWVPGWIVVLLLGREIWVTGLRSLAASRGLVISAGGSGKIKTALQMIAILCIMTRIERISILGFGASAHIVGTNLLLLSVLFSYWSAIDYTVMVFSSARSKLPSPVVTMSSPFQGSGVDIDSSSETSIQ